MADEPYGSFSAAAKKYSTTTTPVLLTDNSTVTLQPGQILVVQNHATEVLYIRLGGTATSEVFHYVVPACVSAKDGTSPPFYIDNWLGIVTLTKASSPSYTAVVLTT